MDALLAALADPARWRLVSLLAEGARSVGVLAQLAEARQPQTTKHLQTLERAGLVTSQRTGQRRVYALRSAPLRDLATALSGLAGTAEQVGGPRATYDQRPRQPGPPASSPLRDDPQRTRLHHPRLRRCRVRDRVPVPPANATASNDRAASAMRAAPKPCMARAAINRTGLVRRRRPGKTRP